MNRFWIHAAAVTIATVAGTLLSAQTTAPATGKFGLPIGMKAQPSVPAMAAPAAVPVVASPLVPAAAPAPAAVATPASTQSATSSVLGYQSPIAGIPVKEALAKFQAQKQGQLGGGVIRVVKFQFHPPNNRAATTGSTQTAALITITKNLDAASVPMLQALSTNELITSSTLTFYMADAAGRAVAALNVTFPNAIIVSVNQYQDSTGTLEDVTLSVSQITIDDLVNKTEFHWNSGSLI